MKTRSGMNEFKIIVSIKRPPMIKDKFVLKSEYLPLFNKFIPYDYKLAFDKRTSTPVFMNIKTKTLKLI